jgi:hypothetical protein
MKLDGTEALDALIQDLAALGDDTEEIACEMLDAGGAVLKQGWEDEIKRRGYIRTGQMQHSIAYKTNKRKRMVEAYPTGKAKYKNQNGNIRAVSNAQKAYVLHHGKKGLKASYFVDDILAHSGGKAGDAMRQILDRHIQKKGL